MRLALLLGAGLVLLGCSCNGKGSAESGTDAKSGERPAEAAQAEAPIPADETAFLAELVPLPDGLDAVEVRYAIEGPALRGEMTTLLTAGGNKRERWELRTTGEAELRSAGTTITNAEQLWTETEGSPGQLGPSHLGALARAYMALDPEARATVVESIRAWHRMLAEQREADHSTRGEVLGVACLQTRIAAQNVCMWEETGLLLRYEGSAFTIQATAIDRHPEVPPDAFELPPEAAQIQPREEPPQDYAAVLAEIAAGSYANVSLLVLGSKGLPSFRLPDQPSP